MDDSPRARVTRRIADVALVLVACAVDLAFWGGDRTLADGTTLPVWIVPAVAVCLCGLLLLRHRYPLGVWGATWAYACVNLLVPEYYPFAYLLVACYAVASRASDTIARLVLVTSALPLALFAYRSAEQAAPDARAVTLAAALASWAIILSVPWGLGRLAHAREEHARAERARLAAEAEKALVAQRLRLAHELHDSVTGAVAGMILHAGAARGLSANADPRVRRALEVIELAGARAMTELHSMLGLLRATEPEVSAAARLADLDHLLEPARSAGLDVRLDTTGTPLPLTPDADLAAYRTIQEALTNATKHAGRGATVTIAITWREHSLDLRVHDHGGASAAAPALSAGLGLRGLRERLDALGGALTSGPDRDGWFVHATLPVTEVS